MESSSRILRPPFHPRPVHSIDLSVRSASTLLRKCIEQGRNVALSLVAVWTDYDKDDHLFWRADNLRRISPTVSTGGLLAPCSLKALIPSRGLAALHAIVER